MNLYEVVQQTVQAQGLDLVEIERAAGGLLRIFIDIPWEAKNQEAVTGVPLRTVTIEDCENVSRQLQYVLQVQDVDYHRLEISSPGIDRLLRNEQDFERFTGYVVDIVLKQPLGANNTQVSANRKKFRGTLEKNESGWQIVWSDAPEPKPGQRVSKKRLMDEFPKHALAFTLDEVREVRLAPLVDFKGRSNKDAANAAVQEC